MKGIFACGIISALMAVNVFAVTLPEGTVGGLPQNLIVMDENGYSPEDGELYIYIENMIPNEVYTKDIAVMNARQDAQYAIYMTATPNYNEGNIDLLGETVCKLYLDGDLIYEGLVNGDGTPNMQTEALDLGGVLKSGESRNLHAEFQWVTDMNWDPGENFENEYYGEVSFIWTFYASVPLDEEDEDDDDGGGGGSGGGGSGNKFYPEGNKDLTPPKTHTEPPTHDYEGIIDNGDDGYITHDTPDEAVTETTTSDVTDEGIIEKIVDKLPIPEDVKTGYYSDIVFYIKLAVCAFLAAAVVLALIIYKSVRLKQLKRWEDKGV